MCLLMVLSIALLCSRQLAEEVIKGDPSNNEEAAGEGGSSASLQGFEGMEALAKAIELGALYLYMHKQLYT